MTAPRRRWSFSLRTLLVLLTMAAIGACWVAWVLSDSHFHDTYIRIGP